MLDIGFHELCNIGAVAQNSQTVKLGDGTFDAFMGVVDHHHILAIDDQLFRQSQPASSCSQDDYLLARIKLLPFLFQEIVMLPHDDSRTFLKAKGLGFVTNIEY